MGEHFFNVSPLISFVLTEKKLHDKKIAVDHKP